MEGGGAGAPQPQQPASPTAGSRPSLTVPQLLAFAGEVKDSPYSDANAWCEVSQDAGAHPSNTASGMVETISPSTL